MLLNSDFRQRVVIRPEDCQWAASPAPGIERLMLDRRGAEVARATSLVRYAPHSQFPQHRHDGGEEMLVLEGELRDEHGRYPAGSYLRNPIGSQHTPRAGAEGALLFVKLWQFDPADNKTLLINTADHAWQPGVAKGLQVMPLHQFAGESTALVNWAPNTNFNRHRHIGGEEILVLAGHFHDEHGDYPQGSWIRNPAGSEHSPFTRKTGALIYVKTGHLWPQSANG